MKSRLLYPTPLLILLLLPSFASAQNTTNETLGYNTSETISECITELSRLHSYLLGDIAVNFKTGVANEEILTFLETNNLSYWGGYVVQVPKGTEIEWVCRINQEEIVQYALLISHGISNISTPCIPTILDVDEILSTYENRTWLHILVRLKDEPGIAAGEVIATLPQTEIMLIFDDGDKFDAFLTRKGFEIILNNSNVRQVMTGTECGRPSVAQGESGQIGESEINGFDNQTLPKPPEVGPEPEHVEIKPGLSWFGRLFQFLKALFGLN